MNPLGLTWLREGDLVRLYYRSQERRGLHEDMRWGIVRALPDLTAPADTGTGMIFWHRTEGTTAFAGSTFESPLAVSNWRLLLPDVGDHDAVRRWLDAG